MFICFFKWPEMAATIHSISRKGMGMLNTIKIKIKGKKDGSLVEKA